MNLEEFRKEFLENVRATAEAEKTFLREAFVTVAAEALIEAAELSDYELCCYKGTGSRNRSLLVDAYSFDEVDGSARLLVANVNGTDEMETLTLTEANTLFARLQAFAEDALNGRLHAVLEPSSAPQGLAQTLHTQKDSITRFRCFLVTDSVLSGRIKELPEAKIGSAPVEFHIWDIARFHRIAESKLGRDELRVEFEEFCPGGIPCLAASVDSTEYGAYLCVLPGKALASIYDRYGSRLLEGNVRSFLSTRGKVNKGIRSSILNEPTMFFAYNNGIAATATSVEVKSSAAGLRLRTASDLQIVNGGQTTASLSAARRDESAELAHIFVQMKLSVVPPEKAEAVIPQISRFANTQNKVSDADFFANHPFHVRIEQISRRLWAPTTSGMQHETHWFYERARGQYLNEQTNLSAAEKRRFQQQNPREQVLTKTDLAKFENSWLGMPHKVSQGAQKNFLAFAEWVNSRWDADEAQFNEEFFRQAVAKAILFKDTAKLVSDSAWYEGGYRANIVTYTVAKMVDLIGKKAARNLLDLKAIWARQEISSTLQAQIALLAAEVFKVIVNPIIQFQNVTEWCKKELCWQRVAELDIPLLPEMKRELVSIEEVRSELKDAKAQQRVDAGIEAQKTVLERGAEFWKRMRVWGASKSLLTRDESGILSVGEKLPKWIPTEAQSIRLLEIMGRLEGEGFKLDP